jgi:mycothiol synthase
MKIHRRKPAPLIFRGVEGERDYPLLLAINLSSRQADGDPESITLEQIAEAFAPSDELDPARHVLIACLANEPETAVGYSRLGWYSSRADTRLYYQYSRLTGEYRRRGWWEMLVRQTEQRIREIAREHPPVAQCFFQGWASDNQRDWIKVLDNTAYQVVRRFHNMLYILGDAPDFLLPAGFEIRQVKPEHMRLIWEAQKEMNQGLFENVVEDWLDEKFPLWLEDPGHTPLFWQVAWAGDQIAGMVLARIDDKENQERQRKHGYTEHIYVRPAWRKRGLASALIARSLQVLKEQGILEAELGVDAENESAAFNLYQQMGYKTFSIDTWFRKPMHQNSEAL